MITAQFDHQIVGSFVEYVNNIILRKGEAFSSFNATFYQNGQNRFGNYVYTSQQKGFVYDSGLTGIPTGFYRGTGLIGRGVSGMAIDFKNGAIQFTGNPGNVTFTGQVTLPDFNVKYVSQNEENFLMETKFFINPIDVQPSSGLVYKSETYPAIFVTYAPGNNEPFEMGGKKQTEPKFTCIVVADNAYQLDGALGLLRDCDKRNLPILELSELPFNVSGDLKTGSYNYTGIAWTKTHPNMAFIDEVRTSKASPRLNREVGQNVFIGFADFTLLKPRHTTA